MSFDNFSGFVLAGGKSSRMETDKAFLEVGGETFLTRAVKTLQTIFENRVRVVFNRTQNDYIERLPDDISHIFDVYENRGALGGIQAALTNCATEFAVVLAVDLPNVTTEAIEKLASIALSSSKFIAVVPRQNDDRLQPLCAVYHVRYCLPALENLMAENNSASVGEFLEIIAPRFIAQDKLSGDRSNDIFFNVNRPADFHKLSKDSRSEKQGKSLLAFPAGQA